MHDVLVLCLVFGWTVESSGCTSSIVSVTCTDALDRLLDRTLSTLSAVYTDTTIEGVVVPVVSGG